MVPAIVMQVLVSVASGWISALYGSPALLIATMVVGSIGSAFFLFLGNPRLSPSQSCPAGLQEFPA